MKVKDLHSLFHEQLKDLYSAESQILDALPDMIESARDSELRNALQEHLEETRAQKKRLEEIGQSLDMKVKGHKCKGMEGIISEGEDLLENDVEDDRVMDAAIVAAAQRVEHYEIAGYGTARTYARMLGEADAVRRLEETLEEEKNADATLTRIAEDHVNRKAVAAD